MNIQFEPTIKQWEVFDIFMNTDSPITDILYGGSAGSAKSYLICALLHILSLKYPKSRWGLGRKDITTLKKTTMTSFFEVASDFGIKDLFNYNQQGGIVKYSNGSEVVLLDLDYYPSDPDYSKLGGYLLTGAFIDEAGELTDSRVVGILKSRSGRWKNELFNLKPMLIMSANPSQNFLFDEYYLPSKNKTLKEYQYFIPALPTDNPYLPESYLQNLRTLPDIDYKRLYLGEWQYSQSDLDLFLHEDITNCYIQREIEKTEEKYLTVDIAVDVDDCVAVYWEGLIVKDIKINDKNTDPVLFIKNLQKEYDVPVPNITYDASGVGNLIKRQLPSARAFMGASKALNKQNYKNIRHQCYFKLSEVIRDNEILFETTKYKERIFKELKGHKRKELIENKVEIIPKKDIIRMIGSSPDIADCLSMRMIFEIKKKKIFVKTI